MTQTGIAARDWTAPPADVLLADGSIAVIRSLRPDDRDGLLALHESVSEDTLRLRFFSPNREAGRRYVAHLFDPANASSAALVVVAQGHITGLATAEQISADSAEVAFLVADGERGRGLGSLLLEHLAALGRQYGVRRFEADVLTDNYAMLRVFRRAGFAASRRTNAGEISFVLHTDASQDVVDAADRREWRAEALSLRPLLYPRSVAVVGVRRAAGGFGRGVLEAIRSSAYSGRLHVVHPEATEIDGLPTVPSLAAVGEPVDLVVIAVPAESVAAVLREAAAAGAGAVCVVSSGFAGRSAGADELLADRAGRTACAWSVPTRRACWATPRTSPSTRPSCTSCRRPEVSAWSRSPAAWASRCWTWRVTSGSACTPSSRWATRSTCRATTCSAAWMEDDRVSAAALYLESFGNALKFARTARRFAERKPLLALVGGRSRARLDRAHDGAQGPGVGVDALLTQAGVIACPSGVTLCETALLLTEQPLPAGLRIGIVSNTGGLGTVAMDLVDSQGLDVVAFSAGLRAAIPEAVDARNPVDLGADVTPDRLEQSVSTLLASDEVDVALVLLVSTRLSDRDAVSPPWAGPVRRPRRSRWCWWPPGRWPPSRAASQASPSTAPSRGRRPRSAARCGTPSGAGSPTTDPSSSSAPVASTPGLGRRPARRRRWRTGVAARRRDDRAARAVRDRSGGHRLPDGGRAAGRRRAGLPGGGQARRDHRAAQGRPGTGARRPAPRRGRRGGRRRLP